jgi:hypothetical protein
MNVDDLTSEKLSPDDEKIAGLLGGLKRVEAPGDFEFRLKARMANAEPPRTESQWMPMLVRYAVPMALLIAIAGLMFVNSGTSPENVVVQTAGVLPVTTSASQTEPMPAQSQSSPIPDPVETAAFSGQNSTVAVNRSPVRAVARKPAEKKESELGGSIVRALSGSSNTFRPRGLQSDTVIQKRPREFDNNTSFSITEVFSMLGIDATYEASGWTVKTVRANTPADHSGLKAGDVIEKVNDTPVSRNTVFNGTFTGRVLSVRRSGQSVQINLQNK